MERRMGTWERGIRGREREGGRCEIRGRGRGEIRGRERGQGTGTYHPSIALANPNVYNTNEQTSNSVALVVKSSRCLKA